MGKMGIMGRMGLLAGQGGGERDSGDGWRWRTARQAWAVSGLVRGRAPWERRGRGWPCLSRGNRDAR